MASERTVERIFDKLDDISERLARVETQIEQNHSDHNNMISMIADLRKEVDTLQAGHNDQQSTLDKNAGKGQVYGGIWQLILALVSGGILVAIGGLIAKAIGLFGG